MSETNPRLKYFLWFVLGSIVGAVGIVLAMNPALESTSKSQEATQNLMQQKLSSQLAAIKEITDQRDTCTAKFQRATFLYDVGLFNAETRAWVIPVDVVPVAAPNHRGSFSHFDPKTQVKTVHFQAKAQ
jgi:Tfp pilus assembly protein PilN